MNRGILLKYLLIIVFTSCTSIVDLKLDEQEKELVLNCILNTASDTITAWLTLTAPITGGESYEPVTEATIRLMENDQWTVNFNHTNSGAYQLLYKIKPGASYRIEAITSNKTIWAETRVPLHIDSKIDTVSHPFGNIPLYTIAFTIQFDDCPREKNYYWIAMQKTMGNGQVINEIIYSNTLLADDFNRFIEDYNGFRFNYGNFMRLDDVLFSGQSCDITFGGIGYSANRLNVNYRIFFLHVDQHFDRYLKTALVRREMDAMSEDFPIYYSPFPVYSNIKNGKGIFGSVNTYYKDFPL